MDIKDVCGKLEGRRLPDWAELPELELYMDQVVILIGRYLSISQHSSKKHLTPAMVNNYVKMGAMPPPVKKKYGKPHIAHLIIICLLKQVLPIADVYAIIEAGVKDEGVEQFYQSFRSEYHQAGSEASCELTAAQPGRAALSAALRAQAGQAAAQRLLNEEQGGTPL